jgi:hypothetical protein
MKGATAFATLWSSMPRIVSYSDVDAQVRARRKEDLEWFYLSFDGHFAHFGTEMVPYCKEEGYKDGVADCRFQSTEYSDVGHFQETFHFSHAGAPVRPRSGRATAS